VPVPIHKKRLKKRGYNQSSLIAKAVAKALKVKFINNLLYKIKNTVPQSSLSEKERKLNVRRAYIVRNSQMIKDKIVLLIDDIYTTGATVEECSKELKEAGAKDVIVATIAK
jgi:ComF family protein